MSSGEDDYEDQIGGSSYRDRDDDDNPSKKRRIQRACDICRRKKIRCDGPQMPNNRCSNCVAYHHECTYVEAAKKRGPPKGYVEGLENRLAKMEELLKRISPGQDFTAELGGPLNRETWMSVKSPSSDRTSSILSKLGTGTGTSRGLSGIPLPINPNAKSDDLYSSDDDVIIQGPLTQKMERLNVSDETNNRRYHGKSSGVMLVAAARDLKAEFTGTPSPAFDGDIDKQLRNRRLEFWKPYPWELASWVGQEWKGDIELPPPDLMRSLIELYFRNVNDFWPLLRRQTFDRQVAEEAWKRDPAFAAVLMLLLAVGSRWSDDPRVLLDPTSKFKHSAGWKYFEQIKTFRKNIISRPSLSDLQLFVLCCIFLQGSSVPHACWTVIGVGIRYAQDVGAHRAKAYRGQDPVDDELWRRAFWCLVAMDRMVSSALGLPCAIHDEDFDTEFPHECDDEYWEPNEDGRRFVQPPGKPSKLSFFICYLRLTQILGFALRTIYSINKSKVLLGFVGTRWEQHIVAELDSAMNKWHDSVPEHLTWDPNREKPLWFEQSAVLFCTYYQLQILIHRPFIPSPRRPSPLSFPSLAVCSNAARSCAHIAEHLRKRRGSPIFPATIVAAFTAGIVLLINVWGGKKAGLKIDQGSQLQDIHNCMQILKVAEDRWHSAGRLWDILCELASVGDLPLPQNSPPDFNSHKRDREDDASSSGPSTASTPAQTFVEHPGATLRPIAKAPSRSLTGSGSYRSSPSSSIPGSVAETTLESFPSNPLPPTVPGPTPSFPQSVSSSLGQAVAAGVPFGDTAGFNPPTSPFDPAQSAAWFTDPPAPQSPASTENTNFSYDSLSQVNESLMSIFGSDSMNYFSPPAASIFGAMDTRLPNSSAIRPSETSGAGSQGSPAPSSSFGGVGSQQAWASSSTQQMPPATPSFSNSNNMPLWNNVPYGFAFDTWAPYFGNLGAGTAPSPGSGDAQRNP